jgi:hypothetical protein
VFLEILAVSRGVKVAERKPKIKIIFYRIEKSGDKKE